MPQFTWMARDEHRTLRSGLITAPSASMAAAAIRRHPAGDSLGRVAVLPVPTVASNEPSADQAPAADLSKVSLKARMEAVSHLSMLVRQGVPPARACAVAGASVGDLGLSEALHHASFRMREGAGLADALTAQKGLLNAMAAALLQHAEHQGRLHEGLKSVYQLLEFEEQLALRRHSAHGWRGWVSRLRLVEPVSPVTARLLTLTHFFGCLGLAQRAGLSLPLSLRAAQQSCGDEMFQRELREVLQGVALQRLTLAAALDQAGLLPMASRAPLEQAQAEGSAALADALLQITRELRKHADAETAAA